MKREGRVRGWSFVAVVAGLSLFAASLVAGPALAGEVSNKLEKRIDLLEDVLSDLLIDSPYWLVSAGAPAQGVYLEGFGVLLSFEGSLTSGSGWNLGDRRWSVFRKLGDVLVWDSDDDRRWRSDDEDEDEYEEQEEQKDRKDDLDDETWKARHARRAGRCYERAKEELRELLMDSGDLVSELRDDEWIAIAADLEDHAYFRKQKLSALIVKARAGDVRAVDAKQLSEEQFLQRIVEQEY